MADHYFLLISNCLFRCARRRRRASLPRFNNLLFSIWKIFEIFKIPTNMKLALAQLTSNRIFYQGPVVVVVSIFLSFLTISCQSIYFMPIYSFIFPPGPSCCCCLWGKLGLHCDGDSLLKVVVELFFELFLSCVFDPAPTICGFQGGVLES